MAKKVTINTPKKGRTAPKGTTDPKETTVPGASASGGNLPPVPSTAASMRIDKAFNELVDAVSGHGAMFVICTAADTGAIMTAVAKNHARLNGTLLADAACRFRNEEAEGEATSIGNAIYSSLIMALAELATHPLPDYRLGIGYILQDLSRAYANLTKEKGLELNERGEIIDKQPEAKEQEK